MYDLYDLAHAGLDMYHADPAQPLITAAEEPNHLLIDGRDLPDVPDLSVDDLSYSY